MCGRCVAVYRRVFPCAAGVLPCIAGCCKGCVLCSVVFRGLTSPLMECRRCRYKGAARPPATVLARRYLTPLGTAGHSADTAAGQQQQQRRPWTLCWAAAGAAAWRTLNLLELSKQAFRRLGINEHSMQFHMLTRT